MYLEGVYTAVATPFTETDEVDSEALATLTQRVIAGGGEGIVALGTMGDGLSINFTERRRVLEVIAQTAQGRAGLVAGATAITTSDAVENAILARQLGYKAAMIAPPPYVLPTPEELVNHYREIAERSELPILLYDYPARTGVQIGWRVLDALVDVPQIIGLKEASGDLPRIVEMRQRYGDRYEIVCGADSLIVDFALWGARGWIAGASGFLTAEHVNVLRLATRGEYAKAKEALVPLLPMFLEMEQSGYGHKVRSGLALFGLPAGRSRLPMQSLSDHERDDFNALIPRSPASGVN